MRSIQVKYDDTYAMVIYFDTPNQRYEWGTRDVITKWAARYRVHLTWTPTGPKVLQAPTTVVSVSVLICDKIGEPYEQGINRVIATNLGKIRTKGIKWTDEEGR